MKLKKSYSAQQVMTKEPIGEDATRDGVPKANMGSFLIEWLPNTCKVPEQSSGSVRANPERGALIHQRMNDLSELA